MNTLFDSLPLGAAFLPLGIYLLVLGWVHLRRRPLAIAGVWDGILLGASLLGLVTVGPIALVRPAAGGSSWSWPMLILGFCLVVALCVLVSRPRLIIYNISVEQIRPLVAEVASDLDPQARWAGETVALPTRGLQVHLDGDGSLRTVSLIGVARPTRGGASSAAGSARPRAGSRSAPAPGGACSPESVRCSCSSPPGASRRPSTIAGRRSSRPSPPPPRRSTSASIPRPCNPDSFPAVTP